MKRLHSLFLILVLLLPGCQAAPEAAAPSDSGAPVPTAAVPPPGSGWDGRPHPTVPVPAAGESFFLTYWDGETMLEQFCYDKEDLEALARALPQVQGYAAGDPWQAPENPWPIYGLQIGGTEEDFEAAYCGGVWLDSEGNVLREADVDFPALWERFARNPQPRTAPPPAIRELALRDGVWDPRFLQEAGETPFSSLVPMELSVLDNSVDWTIRNETGQEILTGNGGAAVPLALLDGVWYHIPTLSGKHYAWTTEACSTPSGGTFSGTFWKEPYGSLSDGDYRLVLRWSSNTGLEGLSAAPFHIYGGELFPAEESRVTFCPPFPSVLGDAIEKEALP